MIRVLITALSVMALSGCISQQPAPAIDRSVSGTRAAATPAGPCYYTVKRGDTLYRIAKENGRDPQEIATWNNLVNPSAIKEGQILRVAPPGNVEPTDGAVAKPIESGSAIESRSLDAAPAMAPLPAASSNGVKREPKAGKEPYSDEAYARLNKLAEPPKAVETKPEATSIVFFRCWNLPSRCRSVIRT